MSTHDEDLVTELAETLGMLVEALNAWEGYEQEAHEAGRCIGYGFCQNEPCTEMSPRIDEIRRSIGIQASAAMPTAITPTTELAALEAIDPDGITYAQAGRLAQLQRELGAAERLCTARLSTGPDAWLLCILHEGHLTDHRSGDVTWMGAW